MTPSEVAENLQPVSAISVPSPISWADEERDITAWLGNELQNAAFEKLYSLTEKVNNCQYDLLKKDWLFLQSSDHFYYMCTKFFSDGAVHAYFNPYETPYDAFMNYMNVLSDFEIRLNRMCPATDEQIEILKLDSQIKAKEEIIVRQASELVTLNKKLSKIKPKKKVIPKTKVKTKSAAVTKSNSVDKVTVSRSKTKSLAPEKIKSTEKPKSARIRKPTARKISPKTKSARGRKNEAK
jgi:alpha-amylase